PNVDVDRPRLTEVAQSPDLVKKLLPREDPARPLEQELEKPILRRSEAQLAAVEQDPMALAVELERTYFRRGGGLLSARAPEDRLDAGGQFFRGKRLRQVIVRAPLESDELVHLRPARRQEEHREGTGARLRPDGMEHLEAAHLGEQKIEHA